MSTIAERRRRQHFKAKAEALPKHWYAGCHSVWTGEVAHDCGCGEFSSEDKAEVLAHITSINELEQVEKEKA